MITWRPKEQGYFILAATCGEYELVICEYTSDDGTNANYEGVYYPVDYYLAAIKTGEKTTIDSAKSALLDLVFEQIKQDARAQSETISAFWDLKRSMDRDKLCENPRPSTASVRELIDDEAIHAVFAPELIKRLREYAEHVPVLLESNKKLTSALSRIAEIVDNDENEDVVDTVDRITAERDRLLTQQ